MHNAACACVFHWNDNYYCWHWSSQFTLSFRYLIIILIIVFACSSTTILYQKYIACSLILINVWYKLQTSSRCGKMWQSLLIYYYSSGEIATNEECWNERFTTILSCIWGESEWPCVLSQCQNASARARVLFLDTPTSDENIGQAMAWLAWAVATPLRIYGA